MKALKVVLSVTDIKTINHPPLVSVLWTGGFDSSYRMVQLSKHPVTVQPYYLRDRRVSERNELNAISRISGDILEHPETKFKLLPLITIAVKDISDDREISEAYQRLKETSPMGKQYEWLSRFSKIVNGIELCIEADGPRRLDKGGPIVCIMKHGAFKFIDEGGITSCHVIDKGHSSTDLIKVFGNFRYPIIKITKKEIVEEYGKLGFESTMHKTWFCFKPVNNRPCGGCYPCVAAIEEGMEFRFSDAALERYRYKSKFLYVLFRLKMLEKIISILNYLGMSGTVRKIRGKIR